MPKYTYNNPWHVPTHPMYGPAVYETDVEPVEYRGYLIFHRTPLVWDVVKNGQCVTQRAGPKGAREIIDALIANHAF